MRVQVPSALLWAYGGTEYAAVSEAVLYEGWEFKSPYAHAGVLERNRGGTQNAVANAHGFDPHRPYLGAYGWNGRRAGLRIR